MKATQSATRQKPTEVNIELKFPFLSFADHRSILANTDWKKLWMETGQLMNRIDNNIDSSDSTLPEESEVRP